jgi:hypothetical protein
MPSHSHISVLSDVQAHFSEKCGISPRIALFCMLKDLTGFPLFLIVMIHTLRRNMQPFSTANKVGGYFGISGTAYEYQTRRVFLDKH